MNLELPHLDVTDSINPIPQAILDRRTMQRKEEVLIHWQGLSPADATWEGSVTNQLVEVDLDSSSVQIMQHSNYSDFAAQLLLSRG